MGVQLGSLIKGKELDVGKLKGRKVAIDAFNILYQFLSTIRDRETGQPLMDSKGRVTSHLSGLFYRTAKILEAGITPIYVFDGKPPAWKYETLSERKDVRDAAHAKWQAALEAGEEPEEILKQAKMSTRLTGEMIEQAKNLLTHMGLQWVQAPSEGEAQCAHMCAKGVVWASVSQDWDSFLFGSPRLVRNLSVSGKRKIPKRSVYIDVKPEMLELKEILSTLGINRDQMIVMSMLIGTDFNPGIRGYGPKKALDLVKKEKNLEKVLEVVEWVGPPATEIFNFFKKPPVEDVKIEKVPYKPDKVREMLINDHEFSQERVEKVLMTLEGIQSKSIGLSKWTK